MENSSWNMLWVVLSIRFVCALFYDIFTIITTNLLSFVSDKDAASGIGSGLNGTVPVALKTAIVFTFTFRETTHYDSNFAERSTFIDGISQTANKFNWKLKFHFMVLVYVETS